MLEPKVTSQANDGAGHVAEFGPRTQRVLPDFDIWYFSRSFIFMNIAGCTFILRTEVGS